MHFYCSTNSNSYSCVNDYKIIKKKFTFGAPERLKYSLVSKSILSTLHDKSQPVVDALMSLLLQSPK